MKQSLIFKEKLVPDVLMRQNTSAARICSSIISEAINKKASDLHIEAVRNGLLVVRLRVNGELVEFPVKELTSKLICREIIVHFKRLSRMNDTVTDEAQDGAFQLNELNVRFRVALSPSLHGESFVMRIIYSDQMPVLRDDVYGNLFVKVARSVITRSQGIVIISGPTGSGKSTTMQAMIAELPLAKLKVISIEDPIEREMIGVLQKQVTHKTGWADSIKMALREDPDVIYIGEIRDRESASLAIEASKTGHLVLTTIHANTSEEIVDRLKYLGVEEYEIVKNIELLVAQRLVRMCNGERKAVIEFGQYREGNLVIANKISEQLEELSKFGEIAHEEALRWQTRK